MRPALTFAYPGDLSLKTGGYGYDRAVLKGLRDLGWEIEAISLGEGFPSPSPETLQAAERRLSSLPDGHLVIIDGLAFGVMDDWAERESGRLKIVALVHHPLALETGLTVSEQVPLVESETRALAAARHVIVTSPMTKRELTANFGVADDKIDVAIPGIARPALTTRPENDVLQILSVGSLTRRKGHDVLIEALARLRDLSWQARIVGSPELDPETAGELAALIDALHLAGRVALAGESPDLTLDYAQADLFVLASRYEGYGMVFAEALSFGLPIVACKAGAVPDVVPPDAGILVDVDDVEALAAAIRTLLTDAGERQRRADASARAGRSLPGWEETAKIISNILERQA